MAKSMASGAAYAQGYIALFPHTISFPFVLSLIFRVFGSSLIVAQIVGAIFSALCAGLIFLIGCEVFKKKSVGIIGAAIWVLFPSQIIYSAIVCTENPFNFIGLLTIYLFIKASKIWQYVLIGFLVAFLSAIRPTGDAWILAFAVILIVKFFRENKMRFRVKHGMTWRHILNIGVLCVSFFIISELISFSVAGYIGQPIAKTKTGWNLFIGMNVDANGMWNTDDAKVFDDYNAGINNISAQSVQADLEKQGVARLEENIKDGSIWGLLANKAMISFGQDSESVAFADSGFTQNWDEAVAQVQGHVSSGTILQFVESYFEGRSATLIKVCSLYYYVVIILAITAVVLMLIRKRNREFLLLLGIIFISILGSCVLLEANARYHVAILPILCILAGGLFNNEHMARSNS